tara:strand:- start:6688 stop:7338 length:651 start_codon:yes stop_codon:yes gene_type:complete
MKKILVLAPHADDEVLGCGGFLAQLSAQGSSIGICYVTSPTEPMWSHEYVSERKNQIQKISKILRGSHIFELEYEAASLSTVDQSKLALKIHGIVKEFDPDTLLSPFLGDLHTDHSIINKAALVASRPHACNVKNFLEYETLSETDWGTSPFFPNFHVDISDFLEEKIRMMKVYDNELRNFPHPRSLKGISALAAKRGTEVCVEAAEAFVVRRMIK